ncbi:Pantoate-beta-alanine ligase [Ostreococcus tauri]|uniref:Pantoate--beta-alanine ligase n=1 Tax=Ostreococcus tauri TaxID=70448 RepID=A0A090MAF6_OSTTA|nr:Pantoate-beta-alanine ligase [Ostreococcus tauri]CEF99089.1 Pantoate-beta-alanine ligase [Ostreococcus tauri]|eukprot:XP_003081256.2 Pantoate-beta-alanine ligase [Ostreococcus tauri]
METVEDARAMRSWTRARRTSGETVGFVPTMGCLHRGHLSLISIARARCDRVVVSIYVNETQFAPGEDFEAYPRKMAEDLEACRSAGVDCVFVPRAMYPGKEEPAHETYVDVEILSKGLCAQTRPHFFRGVATVVTKLFNVVEPDVAVFGKKDYQQWRVIRRMTRDLNFAIEIVGGDIVREEDGLAMSSRNLLLTLEKRAEATVINRSLREAKALAERQPTACGVLVDAVTQAINGGGGVVDYVQVMEPESLTPYEGNVSSPCVIAVAAKFGSVRLLDNIEIMCEGVKR